MNIIAYRLIKPPNSIVFIHGGGDFQVPADKINPDRSLIAASVTCIVVCVYPDIEGPTRITIGPSLQIDPGYPPGFVGTILTPKRRLIVDQVDEVVLFDQPVPHGSTQLRCWFSHPVWPEKVFIGID